MNKYHALIRNPEYSTKEDKAETSFTNENTDDDTDASKPSPGPSRGENNVCDESSDAGSTRYIEPHREKNTDKEEREDSETPIKNDEGAINERVTQADLQNMRQALKSVMSEKFEQNKEEFIITMNQERKFITQEIKSIIQFYAEHGNPKTDK